MIFVAAGTQDGRELVDTLLDSGCEVAASVVSHYGEQLLGGGRKPRLLINDKPLSSEAMQEYFREHGVTLCIDASHPYAVNVSENAMAVCRALGVPYLRFERDLTALDYERIIIVHSYEEAAAEAAHCGRHIFLTTGSRNLKAFLESPSVKGCEVTARVLPTAKVIALCERQGLTPGQIVAMQGPFSTELNAAMFRHYEADVIVTKNSGTLGGTDTKLQAAARLGLPVVLIDRPQLAYEHIARSFSEVLKFVREHGKEQQS